MKKYNPIIQHSMVMIVAIILLFILFTCVNVDHSNDVLAVENKIVISNTSTPCIADTPVSMINESQIPVEYYDVPLSKEIQDVLFCLCKEYGVDEKLILAIIDVESSYQSNAVSKSNYGLMQINKINHKELSQTLGISDFLDSEQNIKAGIHMISALTKKYNEIHKVLMAYNMGERGMSNAVKRGVKSTGYSREVVGIMKQINKG